MLTNHSEYSPTERIYIHRFQQLRFFLFLFFDCVGFMTMINLFFACFSKFLVCLLDGMRNKTNYISSCCGLITQEDLSLIMFLIFHVSRRRKKKLNMRKNKQEEEDILNEYDKKRKKQLYRKCLLIIYRNCFEKSINQ